MDAGMQVLEIALKVLLVVPTCQPIHPRCSILLEFKECLFEVINADVVEERGELLLFLCLAACRMRFSARDTVSRYCARPVLC